MTEKNKISLNPFKHRRLPVEHWRDAREMHRIMHSFSGIFRAVLLELLEHPMSRQDIRDTLNRMRSRGDRRIRESQLKLANTLDKALDLDVLEQRDGLYHLTPGKRGTSIGILVTHRKGLYLVVERDTPLWAKTMDPSGCSSINRFLEFY